jgi:hypothetical protein
MRAPNGAGVGSSMSDYNDNAALGSLTITGTRTPQKRWGGGGGGKHYVI